MSLDTPLEIDVTTAAQLLRAGALLLDVREPFEVAICAVAGSRHLPMRQIPESLPDLPRDHIMVMNMCGRGDKDIFTVAKHLGFDMKI